MLFGRNRTSVLFAAGRLTAFQLYVAWSHLKRWLNKVSHTSASFAALQAPSGETNPDIIYCRWADYDTVHLGGDGGSLQIVHATYGGPSCPHRDVTAKLRRAVDFQRQNLGHDGVFIAAKGIHEWIGDPEKMVLPKCCAFGTD
jgi:hypothetical protein